MKIINHIFNKAILAGLFSTVLFSCSGVGEYLPTSEETTSTQSKAYMTINLTGSTSSRTLGGSEAGINTDENIISKLAIALVSSNGSVSTYTSTNLEKTTDGFTITPFQVKQDSYKILLIANPTDAALAKLNGANNYASLQVAMSEISTFASKDNFMMTNAINFDGDVTNIPTVTVTADNTVGNAAHPTNAIQLDRMAVKVRMNSDMVSKQYTISNFVIKKYDGAWTSSSDNKVVLKSFALLNTYKKANLYQSWTGSQASGYYQSLITPNSSSDFVAADFDNGMDTYSTRTKSTSTTSGYSALVDLTHNNALTSLNAVSYCLENNPRNLSTVSSDVNKNVYHTKAQNTTTGVLFRAQLVDNNGKGITFYSYNGKYYADLLSIQSEYSNVFKGKDPGEVINMTPEDIRTTYGVKVYQDGYMYYTHYIYDSNYFDQTAPSDITNNRYYAVIRNSIYEMNVTGINRFGDDIPGGWDYNGDDEIDKKEATMNVNVTVAPWVLDFYSVTL